MSRVFKKVFKPLLRGSNFTLPSQDSPSTSATAGRQAPTASMHPNSSDETAVKKPDKIDGSREKELISQGGNTFEPDSATLPQLKLPPSPVPNFVGRHDILDAMRRAHIHARSTEIQNPVITVLYGLGGSGKTQTALNFALEMEMLYPDMKILFLDASSEDNLKANLEAHIRSHQTEKQPVSYKGVLEWLETGLKTWIMVLDNADNPISHLSSYIPKCAHGNIIITTRSADLCGLPPHNSHYLEGLATEEAIDLLINSSGHENTPDNRDIGEKIVPKLGNLPLALVQAGRYISMHQCLPKYLKELNGSTDGLLSLLPPDPSSGYNRSVVTTIQTSLDQLPERVRHVLILFSHLESASMAHEIIEKAANRQFLHVLTTKGLELDPLSLRYAQTLSAIFNANEGWSELEFQEIINQCLKPSLLRVTNQGDSKFYSMNALVQTYIRSRHELIQNEKPEALVIRLLGSAATCALYFDDLAFNRLLTPHLNVICVADILEACDHFGFGKASYDIGDYKMSIIHLEKCIEVWKIQLGEEHQFTLEAMMELTVAYNQIGSSWKALEIGKKVVDIQTRLLGKEHPDTLAAMNKLAIHYGAVGQHRECLKLGSEVLQLRKKVLGSNHTKTLGAMNNLANAYYVAGQYRKALELREEVLEKHKLVDGPEHPKTISSMLNLSNSLDGVNRREEALVLREEVLEIRKRVLGPEHPDTIQTIHALSVSYDAMGRHLEAVELGEEVMEIQKSVLGSEHPETIRSMGGLVRPYWNVGMYQESVEMSEVVFDLRKRILGPEHPSTLISMRICLFSFREFGEIAKLHRLMQEALPLHETVMGTRHPSTMWIQSEFRDFIRAAGLE